MTSRPAKLLLFYTGTNSHDEGNLYMLTSAGFKIARELRAKPTKEIRQVS